MRQMPLPPTGAKQVLIVYLKSLEMTGFKSFADRTKLVFEPGLIAIVGPNGCGKSNVSDAIRWVLGEQRPTALRGAKMLDVIFNGTDTRQQMNMAEVSITFADCDNVLDAEFNEVTVTRRVFRTGEGAYFINKNPCRLRDIHRMFMGTGIGTTSYSVMAQGQIDAILSSRPEDRRAIFEEAAGITKFKADRKEALRKLEQTEANLLRLADVIREVKRQIGSLQRQAGKARRYQELKDELRGIDLYVIRRRLAALDARLRELDGELADLAGLDARGQSQVAEAEAATAAIRADILENEHRISEMSEAAAQDASTFAHANEMVLLNQQRIAEYRAWSDRDAREATETHRQIEALQQQLAGMADEKIELDEQLRQARELRDSIQQRVTEERLAIEQLRRDLQAQRDASLERERRTAHLQNQLAGLEAQQRSASIQRERLASEHAQLTRSNESRTQHRDALQGVLETLRRQVEVDAESLESLEQEREQTGDALRDAQEANSRLGTQRAARLAQIDLLTEQEARAESFQSGSRLLLDEKNPLHLEAGLVLGPLADKFKASAEYRPALEAVLRAWIDAVVLRHADDAAVVLRSLLACGGPAAARLIAADAARPDVPACAPPAGLARLSDHIVVAGDFTATADALLANVFIAGTLEDVPSPVPAGCTVTTLSGAVFHANGFCELWMPEGQTSSPLARRMAISDGREQVVSIEQQLGSFKSRIADLSARQGALVGSVAGARRTLDESRRQAAQKEGEWQSVCRDVAASTERLAIVAQELQQAVALTRDAEAEKQELARALQELLDGRAAFSDNLNELQQSLQEREADYNEHNQAFTEARIQESNYAQQATHLIGQTEIYEARAVELQRQLEGRSQGVQGYDDSIQKLTVQIQQTQAQLAPMQLRAEESRKQLDSLRRLRDGKARDLASSESELAANRHSLEQLRNHHAALEVELAESRLRRQNHFDRVLTDYKLTPELLVAESDPRWGDSGEPALADAEAIVTRLNNEIQEMGPVNLVAIDEYKEFEERYALLKAQEEDLLKSKEQILDLLRMINKKTSELFSATFEQANAHFETMFTKLFNGGTAKLVLMQNQEDPLECGVEIIARPPGKRLQSISLLSGGERTMTAVSLLFAIYLIKPSPFCLLDELDAALDDSNIGRFIQALREFLVQSQFLLITHNQHTIANSGIVYGVTMPEKGVSKILSMRLPDIGIRDLDIATEAPPETDPTIPAKRPRRSKSESRPKAKGAVPNGETPVSETDGGDAAKPEQEA
jgi:chromosome segregation protein